MPVFAMRGNKSRQFHASYSCSPLEIAGTYHMRGPQPVDAIPPEVVAIFDNYPSVKQVAFGEEKNGVVWQRLDQEETPNA